MDHPNSEAWKKMPRKCKHVNIGKDKNHEIFVRQTIVNVFLFYLDLPEVFYNRVMVHAEVDISNRGKHTKVTKKILIVYLPFQFSKKKRTKVKFKTCVFLITWCTPIIPVFCQ